MVRLRLQKFHTINLGRMNQKNFPALRFSVAGAFLVSLLCLLAPLTVYAASDESFPLSPDSPVITRSLNYLKTCQNEDGGFGEGGITEWVTIALSATGQDPSTWKKNGNSPLDYLRKHVQPSTIWDCARIALAATLAGEDPRNFGGTDYLAKLKTYYREEQIGDPLSLRDDYWGVLALAAAGEEDCREAQGSAAFIKKHQHPDGSWGATTTGIELCADNTAVAIMALLAAGEDPDSPVIKRGVAYLKDVQNRDGGFSYLFVPSNAASDAWVIQALVAAGENPLAWRKDEESPVDHLISLQEHDGSFKWTQEETDSSLLMTAYALPALLGNSFQPAVLKSGAVTISLRIEGKMETLFDAPVTVSTLELTDSKGKSHYLPKPTALSVLEVASRQGGFNYKVDSHILGLFVRAIGDEADHWEYLVNYNLPGKGAAKRVLRNGDEVLWFLNEKTFHPLRVSINREEVLVGQLITANVEVFDESDWKPSSKGTLWVGSQEHPYEKGTGSLLFDHPGTFTLHAESEGSIRSAKKTIRVWPNKNITTQLRIQGKERLLWNGKVRLKPFTEITDMDKRKVTVTGHSLVGALAEAAKIGEFSYQVKQAAQGLIVVSIGDCQEDNSDGSWWYEVNGQRVRKDVDEVLVREGDTILLYYDRSPRRRTDSLGSH